MSGSTVVIDARGLACPQPVILTKNAIEAGAGGRIEVLVDNEAARENVLRFAGFSGRQAEARLEDGGATRVIIMEATENSAVAETAKAETAPEEAPPRGAMAGTIDTVFIPTDKIGHGDDELGALLMRGFIYALAEGSVKPSRIILMNAGVKLAIEGSESLANLRRLAEEGVELLACGSCLDFYGLKDKLAAGRVSNMYEIAELLMKGNVLRP